MKPGATESSIRAKLATATQGIRKVKMLQKLGMAVVYCDTFQDQEAAITALATEGDAVMDSMVQ